MVDTSATRTTSVPSSRSSHEASRVRTSPTKLRARFDGSRPTVSVSPKRSESFASGMTNERVMSRRMPLTSKRVASHRLAARLVRATRASVPIQGRSTPATGGRSTSLSMAGTSPAGTGAVAASSGFSAHGPVSGRAHKPLTASASRPACGGEVGSVGVLGPGEGDGGGPTGARDAGDHGGLRLLPGAQHEEGGVVTDPVHVVGGDELDPGVGAPAEPAAHDVVRRLGVAVRRRHLHGLDHAAPRLLACGPAP